MELSKLNDIEPDQHKFVITIDDGVDSCLYRYELNLNNHISIYDLMKAITDKFAVIVPTPTYIQKE